MEPIMALVGALCGGGVFAFVQFLISRSDAKDEKDDEVLKKLDENNAELTKMQKENQKNLEEVWEFLRKDHAIYSRNRILRFNNELIANIDHSHDEFLNILDDIRDYDEYCNSHPDFPNGRTIQASENIHKTYDRLFEKGKFKEYKEEY